MSNPERKKLKRYLSEKLEHLPTDDELEEIIYTAGIELAFSANIGFRPDRINDNPLEKAFYETWLEENEPKEWINNGHGVLQDLFIENYGLTRRMVHRLTDNERMVAATAIQWLGSNCGMSFLKRTLEKRGYEIIKKQTK